MNISTRLISVLLLLCLTVGLLAGCQDGQQPTTPTQQGLQPWVDYVAETKLELNSDSYKLEVQINHHTDGDTTNFKVVQDSKIVSKVPMPEVMAGDGTIKARYLAVNTPESTGQIEEWGKTASLFTKEKLDGADSIIVESDDGAWNKDSNGRLLVWVWYRPKGETEYRCLNLELVQNGLSQAAGSPSNRYGIVSMNAFMQAQRYKLKIFSDEVDPNYYYGEGYVVDLKEIRTNAEKYVDKTVIFTGIVARYNNNNVYVEQYDEESGLYYGISIFDGYATGQLLTTLQPGNEIRVVGKLTYYEAGGTYQVSNISYRPMQPNDPTNTILVSTGHSIANRLTDPKVFTTEKVELSVLAEPGSEETVQKTYDYAYLAMNTSISMKDLVIKDIYTTHNGGSSDGAMTFTCEANGVTITVRTVVMRKEDQSLYTEADYLGKTIDVVGIVDYFSGEYQIKVLSPNDITVH